MTTTGTLIVSLLFVLTVAAWLRVFLPPPMKTIGPDIRDALARDKRAERAKQDRERAKLDAMYGKNGAHARAVERRLIRRRVRRQWPDVYRRHEVR